MDKIVDLSGLIRGLMLVIGLAVCLGKYPELAKWSRSQAEESIAWERGLPHFFPVTHKRVGLVRATSARK